MTRLIPLAPLMALCVAGTGCTLLELEVESRAFYTSTVLVGFIDRPGPWTGPVRVAAFARGPGGTRIVHQTRLHEPGGFELIVPKGEYGLFAFSDTNDNGVYDAGEPAGEYAGAEPVVATGVGVVASLDISITDKPAALRSIAVGTSFGGAAAPPYSTQAGALADLEAPAFSAANGRRGYWAPMEFFQQYGGNIWFLEPYDPARIPILFVHGAAGSAQDWRHFVDHLDRRRYQAWFFQYPSGAALDSMANLLQWKLFNLQLRHHFEALHIVAHSMGGLVVRRFLLDHGSWFRSVRSFVSLSTPWAGEPTAETGVRYSPAVVPSWRDLQPSGRFMQALFEQRLPAQVDFFLLFGHKGGYNLLRPNHDGAVTLASQLRDPAQAEARMVYGFDEDHTSILASQQVLTQYAAILGSVDRAADNGAQSGKVQVSFDFDAPPHGARSTPVLVLDPVGVPTSAPRSRTAIALGADASGRSVGPIAAGEYDASLVAAAFKTEPGRQRVRVEPGTAAALRFRLVPQGMLGGYVGADRDGVDNPAGSHRPPHETVHIESVTLTGSGAARALVPRQGGIDDEVARYLAGEDSAFRSHFQFTGLAAGQYELTIRAQGYRTHVSRHTVVPGRPVRLSPIVLEPLR